VAELKKSILPALGSKICPKQCNEVVAEQQRPEKSLKNGINFWMKLKKPEPDKEAM